MLLVGCEIWMEFRIAKPIGSPGFGSETMQGVDPRHLCNLMLCLRYLSLYVRYRSCGYRVAVLRLQGHAHGNYRIKMVFAVLIGTTGFCDTVWNMCGCLHALMQCLSMLIKRVFYKCDYRHLVQANEAKLTRYEPSSPHLIL
jgi:hypothetical protein